jgi:hypothetical protein
MLNCIVDPCFLSSFLHSFSLFLCFLFFSFLFFFFCLRWQQGTAVEHGARRHSWGRWEAARAEGSDREAAATWTAAALWTGHGGGVNWRAWPGWYG